MRRALHPLLVLLSLTAAPAAAGAAVGDSAHLFSPEAVSQADKTIRTIQALYGTDLVIRTVPSPSSFKKFVLQFKSPASRTRFYEDWAVKEARQAGPNAIYILVCKDPAPLRVAVAAGREAQKQAFPHADWESLRAKLQPLFDRGAYDDGLREAVDTVRKTLAANQQHPAAPPVSSPWAGVLSVILILVILWACGEFMDAFRGSKAAGRYAHLGPVGFGGGGSLPAGLFATMTSCWLRDLLGRRCEAPLTPKVVAEEIPPEPGELEEHPFGEAGLDHHDAERQDFVHGEP
jgi:uncharacterized membrane protein YgcG